MLKPTVAEKYVAIVVPESEISAPVAVALDALGHPVEVFPDAPAALEAFARRPPVLVVSALRMRGIDGWRFCRLLRTPEYSALNNVPILMVAEEYSREEADFIAADLGVDVYLSWPDDREKIAEVARLLLRGESVRPRLRALVVEDDPGMSSLVQKALTTHRYDVKSASSAREASKRVRERTFDIAVIDFHLPDRSGDDLLAEIGEVQPECACIMITGDIAPHLAVDWMRKGAFAYIRKPFPMEYLIEVCARACRERALLRAEGLLRIRARERHLLASEAERSRAALLGAVEDQKRTEKALDRERDLLRVVIDHLPDSVCLKDAQLFIRLANRAYVRALGLDTEAEALGKTDADLFAPDTAARFVSADRAVLESGRAVLNREEDFPHPDGTPRDVLISRIPLFDGDGHAVGLVSIIRDVTEHKELEQQFRQAQKMESIGRLAGGIAHDFNNMLQSIFGNADLALQDVELGSTVHEDLVEIRNAARRSAELTGKLLVFARRQSVAPETLDLNEAVSGTLPILGRMIGEQIELMWEPAESLWPVRMDPSQLDQVLTNLAVNAKDAISGAGSLSITAENFTVDEPFCESHIEASPGDYVRLSISDTGCGMSREVITQIFEPFYTTKERGKGTGLGLSTVYGIVRQNGGFIYVYSERGLGTTFQVFLPRTHDVSVPVPDVDDPEPEGGTETLLVAEDETAILKLAQRILETYGYTVLTAASPGEALALAEQHSGSIDLLLTDVIMPVMNGRELAEKLVELRPGIPVLYMSGYTADVLSREGALSKNVDFLAKPFSSQRLALRVRQALDATSAGGEGNPE